MTRTATVSLEGNAYAVDPALVGRRVELRYDPEDLSVIDVFCEGETGRGGDALRHRTPHPSGRPPGRPSGTRETTGVDYLGMVAAAHEEQAGTGRIDFSQLAMFDDDNETEAQ